MRSTVFCRLFDQDPTYYFLYVLTGLACWNFVVTSTLHGCQCLYVGETYIRQYPAPMAIYPLRVALGGTFHFLIAVAMVVLLIVFPHGLAGRRT